MTIKRLLLLLCFLSLIFQAPLSMAAPKGAIVAVALESGLAPGAGMKDPGAINSTIKLINELDSRSLNGTIFVTGDMAEANPLYIALLGSKPNHELGVAGKTTNENLGAISSSDQYLRLARAKNQVESNYICGVNTLTIEGYLPQPGSFKPGSLPVKVLEEAKLSYVLDDAGYLSGNFSLPYSLENSTIYALPVSFSTLQGKKIYLSDTSAKAQGLNATQWYDRLAEEYNQSKAKGSPLVAVFHNILSGSGDFLKAYEKFLGYAASDGATFVKAGDLVRAAEKKES